MSTSSTQTVTLTDLGTVPVTFSDQGTGRPFLLLHGGAGPLSVADFADRLAETGSARVITPVHPGFSGTPRPDWLSSPAGLAQVYDALLDELDLSDVVVVGNSIGGWIAAEMAVNGSPRIARAVLIDAVGIDDPDHPVVDFFSLRLDQVAEFSYHDPDKFRIDPSAMSDEQRAAMAGNREALAAYSGTAMSDPTLNVRLGRVDVPVLVLWGDSDRIVVPEFGRAYAKAIPGAVFQLLPDTGHVPQIETPDQLLAAIGDFAGARVAG
jgi:pimeloyl-ACP methyl ester carboxylesterase